MDGSLMSKNVGEYIVCTHIILSPVFNVEISTIVRPTVIHHNQCSLVTLLSEKFGFVNLGRHNEV